jgi:hypothetical protein
MAALPGAEMKTLETATGSTSNTFDTLDPISPSCAGDSGTSKQTFDGAMVKRFLYNYMSLLLYCFRIPDI